MPWLDANDVIDRDRKTEYKALDNRQSFYEKHLGGLAEEECKASKKYSSRRRRCIKCDELFSPHSSNQIFCNERCRKEGE